MTTLLRYQPWSVHRELLNEFNRYFDRADASTGATAEWTPAVDIEEYADKFVLYADVPGVDLKSIEVTLEKGVLTLSGNREKAVEAAGVEARRIERANGRFFRRFSLPDTIDGESVTAKGSNGVLEIAIPKRPAAQPRKITVSH
ncbi:Hsp20/alpha crystallin family protein [Nevskia soli]|uniref:Hsp20/alpha crystallin family protein n=1 Tax=Nevskia soli TaxID=418856 RepID=UPI0004A76380|nr:Hsp20/alpha crystallin family protein [Nevskia soli]